MNTTSRLRPIFNRIGKFNSRIWLAAVWTLASLATGQSSTNNTNSSLSGMVIGDLSGQPLAGAHIVLAPVSDTPGLVVLQTSSASDGRFSFPMVPPGEYRLIGAHAKAVPSQDLGSTRGYATPFVRLRPGEQSSIVWKLMEQSYIEGHVRDDNGNPTGGAKIEAIAIRRIDDQFMPTVVREVTTDDQGHYRIGPFPRSSVALKASYLSPVVEMSGYEPLEDRVHALGFSNRAQSLSSDSMLQVGSRANSITADLAVTQVHGTSVSGTISGQKNLGEVSVSLIPTDATVRGLDAFSAAAVNKGEFQVRNVFPGRYFLVASERLQDGTVSTLAVQEITVAGAPLDNLRLALEKTAQLTVAVRLAGEAQNKNGSRAGFTVFLAPADPYLTALGAVYPGVTDQSGTVVFNGVPPGHYRLSAGSAGPEKSYEELVQVDGATVAPGVPIYAAAGHATTVSVQMSRSADGRVFGSFKARNSTVGGIVIMIPEDPTLRLNADFYYTAEVDQHGAWDIAGVRPGKYAMVATDRLENDEVTDALVIDSLARGQKRIEIRAGATVQSDELELCPR
ncbi:MAG: carboxypeptidase regulatory-like domain-containing protein [Acidobacteriota bacterium]